VENEREVVHVGANDEDDEVDGRRARAARLRRCMMDATDSEQQTADESVCYVLAHESRSRQKQATRRISAREPFVDPKQSRSSPMTIPRLFLSLYPARYI
jgi:hypothetical protein